VDIEHCQRRAVDVTSPLLLWTELRLWSVVLKSSGSPSRMGGPGCHVPRVFRILIELYTNSRSHHGKLCFSWPWEQREPWFTRCRIGAEPCREVERPSENLESNRKSQQQLSVLPKSYSMRWSIRGPSISLRPLV